MARRLGLADIATVVDHLKTRGIVILITDHNVRETSTSSIGRHRL